MTDHLSASFTGEDIRANDLAHPVWTAADVVRTDRYWSGEPANERSFETRLVWSVSHLYCRFDASQNEPLIVSDAPQLGGKTVGLWERDVCEIFIAPDRTEPRRYFEFEVAPTGEWLDVAIDLTSGERKTNWDYSSGMDSFATVGDGKVTMAMKIPWSAFGTTPQTGDEWLGNIFRCVGSGPDRGYLAYNPTGTPLPNFHVPDKFVEIRLEK